MLERSLEPSPFPLGVITLTDEELLLPIDLEMPFFNFQILKVFYLFLFKSDLICHMIDLGLFFVTAYVGKTV